MGHFWRCLSAEATGLTVETARSSSHLKPSVLSEPRDCPPLYYAKWTPCRTLRQTKATEQCSISSNSVTTRIPDASTLHGTPSFLVLLLTTVEQNFSEVFIKFRLTTVRRQRSPTTADASPSQAPRSSHTPTDPSPQGAVAPRLRQGWGGGEKRAGPPRPHPAWYGPAPRPPPATAGWFAPRATCSPRREAGPGGAARATPPALAPPPPAPAAPFASAAAREAS